MMEDRKHIDRIFKEALFEYDVEPPKFIWEDIKNELVRDKRKHRLIIIRSIAASVALLVSFLSGYYLTNQKTNSLTVDNLLLEQEQPLLTIENNILADKSNKINPEVDLEENSQLLAEKAILDLKDNKNENKKIKTDNLLITNNDQNNFNTLSNDVIFLKENELSTIEKSRIETISNSSLRKNIKLPEGRALNMLLAQSLNITDYSSLNENFASPQNRKNKKWSISGQFSPAYTVQNESVPEEEYSEVALTNIQNSGKEITEETMLALNGGMKISYKVFDRLTIESGVWYSKMGQQINNARIDVNQLAFYDGGDLLATNSYTTTSAMGQIRYNTDDEVSVLEDKPGPFKDPTSESILIDSKLQQNYEYIEIPLQLKYKLIDRKIDMQVHCGFSPGVLISNKVYVHQDGEKHWIGYTEGINTINYRASFGLGFDYPISNKFTFNLEPTFKYSINSISLEKDIKPYSMGVFTGISYFFN